MQSDSTVVHLTAQSNYEPQPLEDAVHRLLTSIVQPGTLYSAKVLLKPNLITARNGKLACTDARFIAAVASWFMAHGTQVAVGDSPSFGTSHSVLEAIGALPALRRLGVTVVEFRRTREVVLPGGHSAAMAAAALECDLLINLPRVKAHSQMRVTLAVKNLFGCLSGFHKPWWHMVHGGVNGRFARLLVDLLAVLPSGYTLVDGIVAMHRTGPIHGEPYALGVIAGGANPVAIDTALLALLAIDPLRSPLWCASQRAGMPGIALEDLLFPLASPASVCVDDFIVPGELGPIRFNPFRFMKNSFQRALLRGLGR
jgi:uncharacterized protein (DUF362 family)